MAIISTYINRVLRVLADFPVCQVEWALESPVQREKLVTKVLLESVDTVVISRVVALLNKLPQMSAIANKYQVPLDQKETR